MLLALEFAAPFRTRDLETSSNETHAIGKAMPTCSHSPALCDTLPHAATAKDSTGYVHLQLEEIWLDLSCWIYWLWLLLLQIPTEASKSPQRRTWLRSELHLGAVLFAGLVGPRAIAL